MRRHGKAPILTRQDVPDVSPLLIDASSVFNPGAIRVGDRYVLLLRVQARSRETFLMFAESSDGVQFSIEPKLAEIRGLDRVGEMIYHVYDPRLVRIDGEIYCTFAADVDQACRVGVARVHDSEHIELLSIDQTIDSRNSVLFPEKIDGRYVRLDRPNRTQRDGGPKSGSAIELSWSEDLRTWHREHTIMEGRPHYWDELIGSGPPPIKTEAGWLLLYHGIATHFQSSNIYQAGVVLLDADEPWRVLGRSRNNILEPREVWELTGQVPNVVFPSGMIAMSVSESGVAQNESEVYIYYGAADSSVGLAITRVADLLAACNEDPI